MKLCSQPQLARPRKEGMTLIECLVYIAVFGILLGLGTASFFFCWNHTRATIYATSDIESALRAGESWRKDVRAATGAISAETNTAGEVVRIPEGGKEVFYRFAAGELWRQTTPGSVSQLLLPKVISSEMQSDPRDHVAAWRWDLELVQRRHETRLPLLFTFEAVTPNPP